MILRKIKGVHLNGRKDMSTGSPIKDCLNPEFVYIPLTVGNMICTPTVIAGEAVKKGQIIVNREGRFGHPICSPVSGTVTGIKKMWHPSGKMVEMLEIANDTLEEAVEGFGSSLTKNELTKEKIIERVKNAGIVGLGGAGFPAYVKYLPTKSAEIVLINAAECEPYITADYLLIQSNVEKLLRGVTYIMLATGAPIAKIAIKKTKRAAIEVLQQALVDYPNIEIALLKDVYPAGWEKYIVEAVVKKTYQGLPSEVGAVVNNVQTAIAVCEAVEENKPLIEKIITLTGEGLKHPCNLRVKIGTKISSLIPEVGGYVENLEEAYFIAGGPMTGRGILFDDLIVTASLGSVIVMPKQIHDNNPTCMGCGKCAENCPAFLTPTEIKRAHAMGDMDALNALNTMKCVQCGLCSYVCPSRIEMTEYVGKAKDAVAKDNQLKATAKK